MTGVARGQSPKAAEPADVFGLDLESLLNTKVTTASKFAEKQSQAPGMMSVVTRDELKRFGGLSLREILERVPGLAVDDVDPAEGLLRVLV